MTQGDSAARRRVPVGRDDSARRRQFYRVSPCGASFFPSDGKETKGSPGDAAGANFVRHDGLPPGPHYGGYPLGRAENFRRAKMEWHSAIQSGPLGPGYAKIVAAAAPQLRLALPNQRSQCGFRRRGDPCGRPTAFPWGKADSPYQGADSPYQGEMSNIARQRG